MELFRTQDRVAAEVTQAYAQVQSATLRMGRAEGGLKDAVDSVNKNFEMLGETKPCRQPGRVGGPPQEVIHRSAGSCSL